MENVKSPIRIYREKKDETYTSEEVKAAFENSYAVCFNYDRGHVEAKHVLFGRIWALNPDVIITKADLCIMATTPMVRCDQFLLINRGGTPETTNEIARLMAESGIISYEYRFAAESKEGMKICFGSIDLKEKPQTRFKGNLLMDGDQVLLTARPLTKEDREKLKTQG